MEVSFYPNVAPNYDFRYVPAATCDRPRYEERICQSSNSRVEIFSHHIIVIRNVSMQTHNDSDNPRHDLDLSLGRSTVGLRVP